MKAFVLIVICIVLSTVGGAIAGHYIAAQMQAKTDSTRAEAQATFTGSDEATIEFPAFVRGRMVHCTVVINTKRRAQAVFC